MFTFFFFFFFANRVSWPHRSSRLETEVSMDAARASPCGSPYNGLRSRMLQFTCKFRSGQGSNPGADTAAGAHIPLDQSNLVIPLRKSEDLVHSLYCWFLCRLTSLRRRFHHHTALLMPWDHHPWFSEIIIKQ